MNRRVRVLLSLVALVAAVAGCSSGSDSDRGAAVATTALPTTTLAAGPPAFLSEVRAMEFGDKDMASGSDDVLLEIGNMVCEGLGEQNPGFGRVV
jgi:hypothetical protein